MRKDSKAAPSSTFFLTAALLCGFLFLHRSAMAQDLKDMVERELEPLLETHRHLHTHPELSYYEKETAAFLAERLTKLGYEVTEGVGRYANPEHVSDGLVAVMPNGDGPTVLVRTDLDALPVEERTGLPYASSVRTIDDAGADDGG